jgi:5S rRNA maturation endonuclease (ribonuclease M5)
MDNLINHQGDTLRDHMDESFATVSAKIDTLQPTTLLQVKDKLQGMFAEMQGKLGQSMHAGGRSTVARAVDTFTAKFNNLGLLGSNVSALAQHLDSETSLLMSTVNYATSQRLSNSAEVALKSVAALRKVTKELQQRHHALGVYRDSIKEKKTRQEQWTNAKATALSDMVQELQKASAKAILLDFDRTWWTLRTKLDNYVEAASAQDASLGRAVTLLEQYTVACSADFSELAEAHSQAWKSAQEAHVQLRDTWRTVEEELGLLASKIADSGAFSELLRLDAGSVDFDSQRSDICAGKANSTLAAVKKAFKGGLADQTWEQLMSVYMETPILIQRFAAGGLQPPKGNVLLQAMNRVVAAYGGTKREELAHHLVLEYRGNNCGDAGESALKHELTSAVQTEVSAALKQQIPGATMQQEISELKSLVTIGLIAGLLILIAASVTIGLSCRRATAVSA